MNYAFLRNMDYWLGPILLRVLAPLMFAVRLLLPKSHTPPDGKRRCVFLKLKGGGSLIIAMPALLAMRQAAPQAEFILVCTNETKVFAELLGVFNDYYLIKDKSLASLISTGLSALKRSFRADICLDLEPNSMLATVFCLLTSTQRCLGLIKPESHYRMRAYTEALSFNIYAPIYVYYDQLAQLFGEAAIPNMTDCKAQLLNSIPNTPKSDTSILQIALAPFTSDFAPERMMSAEIWANLLQQRLQDRPYHLAIFGSGHNKRLSEPFVAQLKQLLPHITIIDLCGEFTLAESAAHIMNHEEFWAVDSGLLHIARILGVPCRSFWGPTDPQQRLRPIESLREETRYRPFVCSPCVHIAGTPPCGGDNICMKTMAEEAPDLNPVWPIGAPTC